MRNTLLSWLYVFLIQTNLWVQMKRGLQKYLIFELLLVFKRLIFWKIYDIFLLSNLIFKALSLFGNTTS